MTSLELNAHAKINLSLDVLYKREDSYHELKMIMQSIELHDTVYIDISGSAVDVECVSGWAPSGDGNIAYKAAAAIMVRYGLKCGLKIRIKKRIPVAAGLAGGSADAAAVLKGIDSLFQLGLKREEFNAVGKLVGADVPYCISGGTMLAEGIGEVLSELAPFAGVNLVLLKPKIGVSTAWVYKNLDLSKPGERPDTELLKDALTRRDIRAVAENMRNVLESVTIPRFEVVRKAKDRLLELGALGSMMSGSGPSVFGLFADRESALKAYEETSRDAGWQSFLTYTL